MGLTRILGHGLLVGQHYNIIMSVHCYKSVPHPDMMIGVARLETLNKQTCATLYR